MSIINLEEHFEAGKKDVLYFDVLLKGTNISVREVLRLLSQGKSINELLESNPGMTLSDIHTCLRYGWELVGAIDFKKAVSAVNNVNKKRQIVVDKIRSMKANPSQFSKNFTVNPDEKAEDNKDEKH